MTYFLDEKLQEKLRSIMRDHSLAKFGDALTNFLYSLTKTKVLGAPYGERVFDKSLAEAIRSLNLRTFLPSNLSSGEIGDGAEALIGYAFLHDLLPFEEMLLILVEIFQAHYQQDEEFTRKQEKITMTMIFEALLKEIVNRLKGIK